MNNAFLNDFIKMRRSLGAPDTTAKGKQKEEFKEKHLSGMSVATIIEKKPPAKLVLRFFKKKYGDDSSSDEN